MREWWREYWGPILFISGAVLFFGGVSVLLEHDATTRSRAKAARAAVSNLMYEGVIKDIAEGKDDNVVIHWKDGTKSIHEGIRNYVLKPDAVYQAYEDYWGYCTLKEVELTDEAEVHTEHTQRRDYR